MLSAHSARHGSLDPKTLFYNERDPQTVVLKFDGGFHYQMGVGAWAYTISRKDPHTGTFRILEAKSGLIEVAVEATSNYAEYMALLSGIRAVKAMNPVPPVEIYGDSSLVVNMVTGKWGRKNPHKLFPKLLDLLSQVQSELAGMRYSIEYIPREMNGTCDYMCRQEYKRYNPRYIIE